jgi:hypothetical protein
MSQESIHFLYATTGCYSLDWALLPCQSIVASKPKGGNQSILQAVSVGLFGVALELEVL